MTDGLSELEFVPVNGKYDMAKLKSHFMKGGVLTISSLTALLDKTTRILDIEHNLIDISGDTVVWGDFHGQYFDLLNQLDKCFLMERDHTYVFLGDYVDRGEYSCEVLITLIAMKCNNPNKVILLRGNHESRTMTQNYGFKTECIWKYSLDIYNKCITLFDSLPLACKYTTSLGNFFLCHGGISPNLVVLDDLNLIDRHVEPTSNALLLDLLWADPITQDELDSKQIDWNTVDFIENTGRHCSVFYGFKAVDKFFKKNGFIGMLRGHQCFHNGFESHDFGNEEIETPLCFTIFSAPMYSKSNRGASVEISEGGMNVAKYAFAKDIKKKYNPVLVNGITCGTLELFKDLKAFVTKFLEYAFTALDAEDLEMEDIQVDLDDIQVEIDVDEAEPEPLEPPKTDEEEPPATPKMAMKKMGMKTAMAKGKKMMSASIASAHAASAGG
ncbi:serine/threonine protein phosphatase 2B catalytic subunit, putative [Entamoeba invadens IP1]|uniref:Serine/threonine-protein phosphatase n=1 Tax=Entamoeba invadens IP1 TaxID=370355 RepID=A0A0A1U4A4_ENTIV|nr:serine/threonine protein phosphatase 2B catalytic subunit, putative [Entamoeba invadens IP1]ELP89052.1 serine/threonine protein phosphatase 2B catalytic subunit, putative [Entamoeba invadens IP1]|eukprot:XP_004255823.1 serine/threonine protein phosphatase 2B catalytic subunit, putative [Entamoeba invadens IP1]